MKLYDWLKAHWQGIFTASAQRRGAWLLVGLGLLPFLVLVVYSHPALDDFSDAVLRRKHDFWSAQRNLYLTWTGRYTTSVFLTELSPVCHNLLDLYWLVPLGALAALMGGLYAFVAAVVGSSWSAAGKALATGILMTLWLHQASSIAEVLYWFNGVAVYTLPLAMLLAWLALMVCYWQAPANSRIARNWLKASMVLGALLMGTNELITLSVCAATGLLMLWEFYRRSPRRFELLLLVVVLVVALAISVLAPGNMNRAAVINLHVSPLWVIVGPFSASLYLLLNWLSSGLLMGSTLLLLPVLMQLAGQARLASLARFHPLLVALLLVMLLALSEVPSYWATGGLVPPRGRSMLYMLFVVGWFGLILVALVRWRAALQPYLQGPLLRGQLWVPPVAAVLWGWLLLNLFADHNVRQLRQYMGQGSNNVVVAYRDWLSGAARRYDAQLTERYQLLRTTSATRLQLPPLAARPVSLLYYDITTDSTYWGNRVYAQYFGKKVLWIGPGGDAPLP